MGASLGQMGDEILAAVKARAGAAWDEWTEADRQLVADCAADAPAVAAMALAGEPSAAAEKAQVDAQLANLESAGASAVVQAAFWPAVGDVLKAVAGAAVKVLLA